LDIRSATEEDAPRVQAYATRLFAESLPGLYSRRAPSLEEEREFIRSRGTVLLALDGDAVIGMLHVDVFPAPQESHGAVFGVSVDREHRGRGVGTALIEALLEWAPSHDITRIEAHAFANNPRAVAPYERLGFRYEGRRVGAVMVGGEPVDMMLMARLFDG
jgi:RimJ/RimL family protein N-acetyltransferase